MSQILTFLSARWFRRLTWAGAILGSVVHAATTDVTTPASRPLNFVAVTLAEEGGAYYDQVVRGAEHAARAASPTVRFTAVSCRNDPTVQMRQIDEFTAAHCDLIVIQRSYAGEVSPAVQRARAAGVIVAAVDAPVTGGTDVLVMPDEEQGGRLAGRFVVAESGDTGRVAITNGPATAEALQLRVRGFLAELHRAPGLVVVADEDTHMRRAGAQDFIRRVLAEHPDTKFIYAVNDPVASYCEDALLAAGRHDVIVIGMEASPRSVKSMRDRQRLIAASPGEDPFELAARAVQLGVTILRGGPRSTEPVLVPFVPVTRENVHAFRGWQH